MQSSKVAVGRRLLASLRERFRIDTRGLAAFRISLAAVLLLDLLLRTRSLRAFYTDAGVISRPALFADYTDVYSIHALGGTAAVELALFVAAGVFAVALLVGYHSRLAALGAALLTASLHARNPMVLNSGDTLLSLLLLWSMFLPLGSRWAVDATESTRSQSATVTPATVAVLLQVWFVYGTNAVHKFRGTAWLAGDAVFQVFGLGQFTVLLGPTVAEMPGVLSMMNYLWLGLLVASPLLLLSAGWVRAILATGLIGGHLSMLLTMQLGVFPLVSITGLLLFYPPFVWDWITARTVHSRLFRWLPVSISTREHQDWIQTDLGWRRPEPLAWLPVSTEKYQTAFNYGRFIWLRVVPIVLLLGVVLSVGQSVGVVAAPAPADTAIDTLGVDQSWQMFAPDPLSTEVWYVAPGVLPNGSTVDIYRGGTVNYSRPTRVDRTYRTARWRKYLNNIRTVDNENHQSYYANYLCDRWNRSHATGVRQVAVYVVRQPARPAESQPPTKRLLTIHDCRH